MARHPRRERESPVSAERYAAEQFVKAVNTPSFAARLHALGLSPAEVKVVDSSEPIGQVLNGRGPRTIAVCDEDAPDGFMLARIVEVA